MYHTTHRRRIGRWGVLASPRGRCYHGVVQGESSQIHFTFQLPKSTKVIDAVRKFQPAHLYVSLDGNKETYKNMRGCNGHDKVMEVVKAVKDEIPVSLMFCLSPWNTFLICNMS